ncbi:hypothetical protein V2G26_001332 [Clonostachys chloroleuca]
MELKTWLQESFVRYAKNSSHSRVKGPEKVKFGFLACDWQYQYTSPPVIAERKIYQSTRVDISDPSIYRGNFHLQPMGGWKTCGTLGRQTRRKQISHLYLVKDVITSLTQN